MWVCGCVGVYVFTGRPSSVVVYSTGWDTANKGPFLADWGGEVPLYHKVPAAFLFKLEIDIGAKSVTRTKLTGHCEHAHVHPQFEARDACRYVYVCAGNTHGIPSPPNTWLRYDTLTHKSAMWRAPPRQFVEELVVIPKRPTPEVPRMCSLTRYLECVPLLVPRICSPTEDLLSPIAQGQSRTRLMLGA